MKLEFYSSYENDRLIELVLESFGLETRKYDCRPNGQRCWDILGTLEKISWFLWQIEQENIELE